MNDMQQGPAGTLSYGEPREKTPREKIDEAYRRVAEAAGSVLARGAGDLSHHDIRVLKDACETATRLVNDANATLARSKRVAGYRAEHWSDMRC